MALLSAHYRSPLPWTESLISQSKARLDRWYRALQMLEGDGSDHVIGKLPSVLEALCDDLNTPKALAKIDSLIRVMDRPDPMALYEEGQLAYAPGSRLNILASVIAAARSLGFLMMSSEEWFRGTMPRGIVGGRVFAQANLYSPNHIEALIRSRTSAKAERDFATADRIRDELKGEGILLEDGPGGTIWRRA